MATKGSVDFRYSSLPDASKGEKCFRLFYLEPCEDQTAIIRGSLRPMTFPPVETDTANAWQALSYAWGDSTRKVSILLDRGHFEITRNLHEALCHLRDKVSTRVLWIDAICINQEDRKEKSSQVAMMYEIYASAPQVHVDLGSSDSDMDFALQNLSTYDFNDHKTRRLFHPGLEKLFSKSWFSRVWVVQEVAAAKTQPMVRCGSFLIPWHDISVALGKMSTEQLIHSYHGISDPIAGIRQLSLRGGNPGKDGVVNYEFFKILHMTRDREATEPRDHIYALMGLVSKDPGIVFDYALPVSQVFQSAMTRIFKEKDDLSALQFACRSRQTAIVPSWCIDFSQKAWGNTQRRWAIRRTQKDAANVDVAPSTDERQFQFASHSPIEQTLTVRGTLVGKIQQLHVCKSIKWDHGSIKNYTDQDFSTIDRTGGQVIRDVAEFWKLAVPALETSLGRLGTVNRMVEGVLWEVAARGLRPERIVSPDIKVSDDIRERGINLHSLLQRAAMPLTLMKDPKLWFPKDDDRPELFARFAYLRLAGDLEGSAFLTLNTGLIGISEASIEVDDIIVLVCGCPRPLVLRPCGDRHQLIAMAYVDGVMDEELHRPLVDDETVSFVLC